MTLWVAIVLGGVATYLTRLLPLTIATGRSAPDAVRRYLDALPIAIIAALAGAGIAVPATSPTHGAELVAGAVVFGVAAWRRNLLLAMLAGIVIVAALRSLGL